MGVHFWTLPTMKLLHLFISIAAVSSAPAPQDEDVPAVVPYVHEEIEALPYVHEDIAAEPYVHVEPENTVEIIEAEAYVHDEPVETHDIAAEPYVHEEIEAEPYVHEEPAPAIAPVVTYAAFPYATHAYTIPVAAAPVAKAESKSVDTAPLVYAAHTGCVNSVGSIVPCAV